MKRMLIYIFCAVALFSADAPNFLLKNSLAMTSSKGVNVSIHGRNLKCPSFTVRHDQLFIAHNNLIRKWSYEGQIISEWNANGFVHDIGFKGDTLFALVAGEGGRIVLLDTLYNIYREIRLSGCQMHIPDSLFPSGTRILPLDKGYWGRFDRYHARSIYSPTGEMLKGAFSMVYSSNLIRVELAKVIGAGPEESLWEILETAKSAILPSGLYTFSAIDNDLRFKPIFTIEQDTDNPSFKGAFSHRGNMFPNRDFAFAGLDDKGFSYFSFGMTIYRNNPENGIIEYLQAEKIAKSLPRQWQICQPFAANLRIDENGNICYLVAARQSGEIQLISIDQSHFTTFE